jgi:lipopolysaccharide transport system ATP-binding protein
MSSSATAPSGSIRAEGLSKQYRIGGPRERYLTLRDSLASLGTAPLRLAQRALGKGKAQAKSDRRHTIWALRDVSFEIAPGDTVGFIGRNGAGKTTLLKLLSRITRPTQGYADIYGRVGSLLEVGTGFHAELTGRENIYLNGAILGLKKAEIDRKFDEIVAFADTEKFLDTPVKRYSSGMTVRLAFAVAAHLEPEILLVDEVLAVGDVAFQRKCLGKMGEVASEGRTVLFVSHNMAVVQALCRRGIVLEGGELVVDGPIETAVDAYLRGLESTASVPVGERTDRGSGWHESTIRAIRIAGAGGAGAQLATGRPARFAFELSKVLPGLTCTFTIYDHLGHPVSTLSSGHQGPDDEQCNAPADEPLIECTIDELTLVPGRYRIDVLLRGAGHEQDRIEGAAFFDVEQGLVRGRPVSGGGYGSVHLPHRWTVPAEATGATDPTP